MRAPSRMQTSLVVVLTTLPLAGCETPTSAPLTEAGAIAAFRPLRASAADTCDTQRQVAEHNGRYDTIKGGAVVVYKAACDVDPKVSAGAKSAPGAPARAAGAAKAS